jgi:phage gp36-like protein
MGYITIQDIEKAIDRGTLQQLTDDLDTGDVVQEIVDEMIETATDEVNLYLREQYTVPLTDVPKLIKQICVTISGYYLYLRRDLPDKQEKAYTNAVNILKRIQTGQLKLFNQVSTSQGPKAFSKRGVYFVDMPQKGPVNLANY